MTRTGKCVNYASCLTAYRSEILTITEGDFVCPECGKPLLPATGGKSFNLKIAALATAVLVLIALGGVLLMGSVLSRMQVAYSAGERGSERAAASPSLALEASPVPSAPAPTATPAVPDAASVPAEVTAAAAPDLDVRSAETQKVKTEVLQRIDLMPSVSEDNKDKLYVSVERARQMGRLLVVPFASGRSEVAAADVAKLREQLTTPGVKKLLDDPTAVFVILGFADTSGDPKANVKISETRARSVLNALHDQCGVVNVMHAVGMGGSQLFDASGKEKNRVVEIWTVLP